MLMLDCHAQPGRCPAESPDGKGPCRSSSSSSSGSSSSSSDGSASSVSSQGGSGNARAALSPSMCKAQHLPAGPCHSLPASMLPLQDWHPTLSNEASCCLALSTPDGTEHSCSLVLRNASAWTSITGLCSANPPWKPALPAHCRNTSHPRGPQKCSTEALCSPLCSVTPLGCATSSPIYALLAHADRAVSPCRFIHLQHQLHARPQWAADRCSDGGWVQCHLHKHDRWVALLVVGKAAAVRTSRGGPWAIRPEAGRGRAGEALQSDS